MHWLIMTLSRAVRMSKFRVARWKWVWHLVW